MKTGDWLSRMPLLRQVFEPRAVAALDGGGDASAQARAQAKPEHRRSTQERLKATLRREQEALSPRALRRTLAELKAIADPQVSEVEGGRRACDFAAWYAKATPDERRDCWLLMNE